MTEDVPAAKDVAWEIEKALARYVASCSQAEQSLPAVQFINNRADEIAAELVKATATPTSPDLVGATRDDATRFLETATRNWSRVPPLSDSDLDDVAGALNSFVRAALAKAGAA